MTLYMKIFDGWRRCDESVKCTSIIDNLLRFYINKKMKNIHIIFNFTNKNSYLIFIIMFAILFVKFKIAYQYGDAIRYHLLWDHLGSFSKNFAGRHARPMIFRWFNEASSHQHWHKGWRKVAILLHCVFLSIYELLERYVCMLTWDWRIVWIKIRRVTLLNYRKHLGHNPDMRCTADKVWLNCRQDKSTRERVLNNSDTRKMSILCASKTWLQLTTPTKTKSIVSPKQAGFWAEIPAGAWYHENTHSRVMLAFITV